MRILIALLCTLFVALAGCAGGGIDQQRIASDHLGHAQAELGSDAVLYMVQGLEPPEPIPGDDECGDLPRDSRPGDGRAPFWLYYYGVPGSPDALAVGTDGAGKLVCEIPIQGMLAGLQPLGAWSVSAQDAARTIADNVDGFLDLVADSMVVTTLARGPTGPVWSMVAVDLQTGAAMGPWAVDAMTGGFMAAPELPDDVRLPESGSVSGTTTGTAVVTFVEAAELSISGGHAVLELRIHLADPAADLLGAPFIVQVTLPSGTVEEQWISNGDVLTYPRPAGGSYSVVAFPSAAGSWTYHVDYCAYEDTHCDDADGGAAPLARVVPT